MTDKQGDPVWYELLTSDADAAQAFYSPLLGWEFSDSGVPDMDYRLVRKNGVEIGGVMTLTTEMAEGGARPMWAGYFGVDDPDTSTAAAIAAGGTVLMEPQDIPGVGRFALLTDPDGAPFYIIKGSTDGGPSQSFAKYEPQEGHCAWNELYALAPDGARAFYGQLFGWTKDGEMDMGEMGKYEFLKAGDYTLGAVMRKPAEMPAPLWIYYFRVGKIDDAVAQVQAGGGQVLMGPHEIPGGDMIIQGLDPQGALFALIGKR